jgi:hypothetical protein
MAVRQFDAANAGWQSLGAFEAIAAGAHSVVAIVKPLASASGTHWLTFDQGTFSDGGSGRIAYFTSTEDSRAGAGVSVGDWQVLGMSKAAGTHFPRCHRKLLSGGSWTHVDGTGSQITTKTPAVGEFKICPFTSALVGVIAIFDTELSDADFEAIAAIGTTQLLVDLGAIHVWRFNQASTATAVQDDVGAAHQTSIGASTVVTGDDPPGWAFDVTVIPPLNFSVRLSGGAANTDPALSIGGAESSASPGSNLFDDISNAKRLSGLVDYRLVYVHNDDADDGSVVAYVPTQLESGREIAVGVPTQLANAVVPAITTDETAPAGVTFSAPSTAPAGVSLDTIPAAGFRGLWLRRTVTSGTAQDPTNLATVKLEISRVE